MLLPWRTVGMQIFSCVSRMLLRSAFRLISLMVAYVLNAEILSFSILSSTFMLLISSMFYSLIWQQKSYSYHILPTLSFHTYSFVWYLIYNKDERLYLSFSRYHMCKRLLCARIYVRQKIYNIIILRFVCLGVLHFWK